MRSSTDTTTKTMLVLALLAALLLPGLYVAMAKTCCHCLSNWEQFVRGWSILLLFYVYICSVCA